MKIDRSKWTYPLACVALCAYAAPGVGAAPTPSSMPARLVIVVERGPFPEVREAAGAEARVNWWDGDLADDRACTECFAASELADFLPACTGLAASEIRFGAPDAMPPEGDVMLIGSRASNPLVAARLPAGAPPLANGQSFRIRSTREGARTITVIEGGDRCGTLYGAYRYLEELGMRFYGLGERGTVRPRRRSPLPDAIDLSEAPSFLSRGFLGLGDRGGDDLLLWMARNRMNYCEETTRGAHLRKKLGMMLARGGHEIQGLFLNPDAPYPYDHPRFRGDEARPKDPWTPGAGAVGDANGDGVLSCFEAHPEWYGLRAGKRRARMKGAGDNYCTSNRDATAELARNLVASLVDGAWARVDVVNLWMLDNGKWCECDACARQGNCTDRLFDVCHAVQREMRTARGEGRLHRDILLVSLAYHETLVPPSRPLPADFDYAHFAVTFFPIERCYAHPFADPACTEINGFLRRHYEGWTSAPGRHYQGALFVGEYYNVSSFKMLPVLFPTVMAADIPWYHRTGTRHLNYMHTPTHLWGTWTLNQHLLARLLWNAGTDAGAILREYFASYYPGAAERVAAFYRHLERATANFKAFKHYVGEGFYALRRRLADESAALFPLRHLQYAPSHPATDDAPDVVDIVDAMRGARRELDAALLECDDPDARARLLEDDHRFRYGEAMVDFYYHIVRTALAHRSHKPELARREFRCVEEAAARLRTMTDVVAPLDGAPSGDANAGDGFEATQAERAWDFFRRKYAE